MICVIIEISPGETEIAGYPVQETPHGQMSVRRVRPGNCKEPKAFAASGRVQAQCLPRSNVWPDQPGECASLQAAEKILDQHYPLFFIA